MEILSYDFLSSNELFKWNAHTHATGNRQLLEYLVNIEFLTD